MYSTSIVAFVTPFHCLLMGPCTTLQLPLAKTMHLEIKFILDNLKFSCKDKTLNNNNRNISRIHMLY